MPTATGLYQAACTCLSRPAPIRLSRWSFSPTVWGGSRRGYSYFGSHLADSGIASLHPQHVGSDNALWLGNPLRLTERLQSAAKETEARSRALDIRFSLDQMLSSELAGLIDSSKIAVAGHSYGANTAMLVSGARVTTTEGEMADLRYRRIRSTILISAPPIQDQGAIEEVFGAVKIPTLHITSLGDTINLPGYRSTVADRLAIFRAMTGSPRTLAVFNTGGHSIFTDRTTRSGPEISTRVKSATRELSTIFLREWLIEQPTITQNTRKTSSDLDQWLTRHKELLDQFILPS